MSRAFVFPGQGAQTIGMGKALAETYPAARAVFEEVDDALGESLSALIWEGEIDAADPDAERAACVDGDLDSRPARAGWPRGLGLAHVDFVAGHSLGEYSAYCAAGSLSLADTARLLAHPGGRDARGRAGGHWRDGSPAGS